MTRAGERVAAIVPVYAASFINEALDSILSQTRRPDEIIVIDDGSPDGPLIEAAVARANGKVTLLRQPNAGAAAARNAGLATTTADWVAFLDADDRWEPQFLERQLEFLERRPDVDLIWADATIVGNTPAAGRTFMSMCPSKGLVTLESLLAQTCNVLTSTVVVRRSLVVEAGSFDVALRRGQDFDLWLRLISRGAIAAYQEQPLAIRRLHGNNLSGTRLTELERARHVFGKALHALPLTPRERQVALQRVKELDGEIARENGKARLASGDFAAAFHFLDEAARALPGWKIKIARLGVRYLPSLVRRLYLSRAAAAVVVTISAS